MLRDAMLALFRRFETLVEPYPADRRGTPPRGLFAFILHFSRPVLPLLIVMSLLTALVSAAEVVFFGYMGELVDWLSSAEREGFLAEYGWRLAGMAALVVIGLPLLTLLQALVTHQSIFGNYPMIGRWLAHRHMLGQSLAFYQDEFAGRVSQKVMQTALAIRETVMKLMDLMVYVIVYFAGAMLLLGSAEPWLMLPLVAWLAGYIAIMRVFVPRLRRVSMEQADARAVMSGRIVDSYSNIQTIKLFADTRREEAYARDAMEGFMGTVHRQMRLATGLTVTLTLLNSLLLASVAAIAIGAWYLRSEERRVGKECRSRWAASHEKNKTNRVVI